MKKSIAFSLVLASVTACGGIGAGDYVVYRVASNEASLSGDCTDDPDHSSNLLDGATFIIYGVATESDDVLYLDAGTLVFEGAATDDGYAFSGKQVDVQGGGGTTFTSTVDYSVTLTDNGSDVAGTFTVKSTNETPNATNTCTSTRTFIGVQLDDPSINF